MMMTNNLNLIFSQYVVHYAALWAKVWGIRYIYIYIHRRHSHIDCSKVSPIMTSLSDEQQWHAADYRVGDALCAAVTSSSTSVAMSSSSPATSVSSSSSSISASVLSSLDSLYAQQLGNLYRLFQFFFQFSILLFCFFILAAAPIQEFVPKKKVVVTDESLSKEGKFIFHI